MVDKPLTHPEKDELVAFGLGKLTPDEVTAIESHLEECATCCETLLDLKDDTFVELVRTSPKLARSLNQPENEAGPGSKESTLGNATDEAISAATILVDANVSTGPADLPAQLRDHARYRIIELIGKGGMGDVYKAEHRLMDRPVALKLINQELVQNAQAVERFRREVRTAARLTHPNIVTAYDAEHAGDVHFLVMEFVEGMDLASVVQQRGPLPTSEACDCIRQAAEGLQHAHEMGMVHRDIKPHNLMLAGSQESRDKSQESPETRVQSPVQEGGSHSSGSRLFPLDTRHSVKILDFGLASFAAESAMLEAESDENDSGSVPLHLTALGSVMGTPDYIAPEQAQDAHTADIRSDIYSLGCTLHYLLTGRAPFAAGSVVEKLKAHAEQEPPALQELRDDVPAELADIVTRMMAKNPAARFQTPGEVAAALRSFADAQQPAAQRPKAKKRFAIAIALLLPLVLAAGIVIYLATDTGQVEIDASGLDLPGAKIVLLKDGEDYATFNLKSDETLQTIRAGEYEIQLQNAPGDVKLEVKSKRRGDNSWGDPNDLDSEPIVLYRGGGMLIRITRQQPQRIDGLTDQDRLLGKWAPISAQMRGKALTAEQLARMAVSLDGDRATFVDPDGGFQQTGTFTIDATHTPKHIDFIAPDGKERMPGIFEFDGDRLKLAWVDGDYARPTDFNPSDKPDHLTGVFDRAPLTGSALGATERDALRAAEAYLAVMDEGNFGQLWNMLSSFAKPQATRDQFSQTYQKLRDAFGKATHRTLYRVQVYDEFPGMPNGRYAGVQYKSDFERQKELWESLLLNLDTDGKWRVNTYANMLEPMPFPKAKADPVTEQKKQAALTSAQEWLKLVDAGKYAESWETSAKINRNGIGKQQMVDTYNQLFKPLGKLKSRELIKSEYKTQMPRAPVGDYAVIQFNTQFTNEQVIETVVLTREADGQWRVSGYFHAEDQNASTPPDLPLGKNLITDPSLENTAAGERYPEGWGNGNIIPKDAYKHQVVEGGKTGKRGWMIEGDGQYAVIPTTRPPAHQAYRYAGGAWVNVEAGAAQIKLLYFDARGQYLGENRSAATIRKDGWHRLTMIDDLALFPTASKLSLALTLIGKGKAVFDDLELTAFDAKMLPENFEAEYGLAKHDPAIFDRWVGHWSTTFEYKQTATSEARTVKGEAIVRKILDDRYLLWQWKSEDGKTEYLSVLGFDEYVSGYHIWLFGSGGEAYERVGQWDAASQMLALDVKPPLPGVTGISTDRFVKPDRIESTLLITNPNGQSSLDVQMTSTRKADTVQEEIALSNGPAAEPKELDLLQKMAGNWALKQTNKPSIWFPDGATETVTERTAWTVGGRFLIFRSYDEKQHMNTLALMSYEPKEKSYHYWHFAPDVFGGQWRITWDASSRGFHWRSIDMPSGWIGTGFNRWIDDDTFDNQALIKDEQGRVLLDSQQEKKRVK